MSNKAAKLAKKEEVYWDSCMFIEDIERREPDRFEVVNHLFKLARQGKILVVTSVATKAEVLYGPASLTTPEDIRRYLEAYFDSEWISLRASDGPVWKQATLLRRATPTMKLPDAIHLATAMRWKTPLFETYDNRLVKICKDLELPSLIVRQPSLRGVGMPLFDKQRDIPE